MKKEILVNQVYKSNYTDIYYRVYGGCYSSVEVYNLDNIWDCIVITKKDLVKHFTLVN